MPTANKTPNFNLPQWAGNERLKRTDWNEAFMLVDTALQAVKNSTGAEIEKALGDFDRLSTKAGHHTTDTLTTDPVTHLDTWTSVVTDSAGHEVARKVDVEGVQADGKAKWTTTITIGSKVVTIVDKETANGWTKEVK